MPTLLKREYWEHKTTFLNLPLVSAALLLMIFILTIMFGANYGGKSRSEISSISVTTSSNGNNIKQAPTLNSESITDISFASIIEGWGSLPKTQKEIHFKSALNGISMFFKLMLWTVIIIYLNKALYEDRKDSTSHQYID